MVNNLYFDFHFHPMFKQYLSGYEKNYPSVRKLNDLVNNVVVTEQFMRTADNLFLHILGSQTSFDEMAIGQDLLGIANIDALELAFTNATGVMGHALKSSLSAPLDLTYFDLISAGGISYFYLFIKELNLYKRLATENYPGTSAPFITILTRKNKAIDLNNLTGVTLAISMEGGHGLLRTKAGRDFSMANLDKPAQVAVADAVYADFYNNASTLLQPADSLKNLFKAMWVSDMDLLYLTLTHLSEISEKRLATHAYGMKLITNTLFYPDGNGLTDDGRAVITAAYEMTAENGTVKTPVLIDIKHMGLKSRTDFYAYRALNGYTHPIVATHMGVTGYTVAAWKQHMDTHRAVTLSDGRELMEITMNKQRSGIAGKPPFQKRLYFNPWSINLMDDDILQVLSSGGIIGVSFDVRILGFEGILQEDSKEPEYLSKADYESLFPGQDSGPSVALDDTTLPDEVANLMKEAAPQVEAIAGLFDMRREGQMYSLCFNILHIAATGIAANMANVWSQIVIGSDYDGLIDPVKIAEDSSKRPALEAALLNYLRGAEEAYLQQNGGNPLLPAAAADLQQLLRNIMYENGKAFLVKWLGGGI